MQTLSSARRTCMASSSAVEWTATVGMPSSLRARSTRSAISPRLAIRILSNIEPPSLDDHQRLAILDRLAVSDQNLNHRAGARRRDLIHCLHRFDDEQRLAGLHLAADIDEGPRARSRAEIDGADHRRDDGAGVLGRVDLGRGRRGRDAPWRFRRSQPRTCRTKTCRTKTWRTEMAGDAGRHPVALELDLGESGFVEQLRQIADDIVIDRWRLRHGWVPGLARHDQSLAPVLAPIMSATPAMASA